MNISDEEGSKRRGTSEGFSQELQAVERTRRLDHMPLRQHPAAGAVIHSLSHLFIRSVFISYVIIQLQMLIHTV